LVRSGVQEILEQGPVMHHGLAQVFGCGFARGIASGDEMRRPIIFHDLGMVDRNVGSALLEVAHWISARCHHVGDETVCFGNGFARGVYELGLDRAPCGGVTADLRRLQFTDVKFLQTLLPVKKFLLSLSISFIGR
jgi:hypothetical protein